MNISLSNELETLLTFDYLVRYEFTAWVEDASTKQVLNCTVNDKTVIDLKFRQNNYDFRLAGPNVLKAAFHQDCLEVGQQYVIIVQVLAKLPQERRLLGRTHPISVVEYGLSVEERFVDANPYVHEVTSNPFKASNAINSPKPMRDPFSLEYFWYNSCGGESSSLDVMIHLRDGKGRICSVDCLKKSVPLTDTGKKEFHQKTPVLLEVIPSLVYADDETENVPLFQIGRQIKKTKKKEDENREREQILKPMRPVPITYVSGQSSRPFSFRIDEVSNHHNRRGFKLKINPVGDIAPFVASGIMWETMYVLSKPRSNRLSAKRKIDYS